MADSINMGGLSLADPQHANGVGGRSAYIPPHLRNMPAPAMDGPPSMMNGGGAWGGPPRY